MLVMGQAVGWLAGSAAALLFVVLVWANDRARTH
jgi:hypothetical protein